MADKIAVGTGQLSPHIQEQKAVDYANNIAEGTTPVDHHASLALGPLIAPAADPNSLDLIGKYSGNSENMRLSSPSLKNPFADSPTGPRSDHLMVQQILTKVAGPASRQVNDMLLKPAQHLGERDLSHMRASLVREDKMLSLLKTYGNNVSGIFNKLLGNQEG